MQKPEKPDYSDQLCHICKTNPATTEHDWEFDADYDHDLNRNEDYFYEDDPKVKKVYFPGPCPSCEAVREKRRLDRLERIRVKKIPETIARYGVKKQHRNANLLDFPAEVLDSVESGKSLFIHGKCGTGKTYLAAAIIREELVLNRKANVFMVDVDDLLSEIKSTFGANAEGTEQELIEWYAAVETLCLDDIGAEKVTEWSASALRRIIEKREANEMRTIFTSNLGLNELAELFGDRIASRISGMCKTVHLTGADRRKAI